MLAAMFAGENPAVAKFGSLLVGNNPFDSKLAGQRQRFLFTFSQTPVPTKNPHTTFFPEHVVILNHFIDVYCSRYLKVMFYFPSC